MHFFFGFTNFDGVKFQVDQSRDILIHNGSGIIKITVRIWGGSNKQQMLLVNLRDFPLIVHEVWVGNIMTYSVMYMIYLQ